MPRPECAVGKDLYYLLGFAGNVTNYLDAVIAKQLDDPGRDAAAYQYVHLKFKKKVNSLILVKVFGGDALMIGNYLMLIDLSYQHRR